MNKAKKYNQYNEFDNLLEGGGDEPAAEDKKEDAKSEKPKSDKSATKKSEKKEDKKEEEKKNEDDDPYAEPIMEPCCCCDCVCANEFTKESSCCGCFPLKCGVVTIGIVTVLMTTVLFIRYFFLFLNEYFHWWYVLVCLFILCPMLVASSFIVSWFTHDSRTTRTMLYTSQILVLSSIFLLTVWNLIYLVFIYKKNVIYTGMGEIPEGGYPMQTPKKLYIFTFLSETVFMLCMFGYFLCVTAMYSADMHGPEEEEKKDEEEDKKSEKSKKSAKSADKPKSAGGDDAPKDPPAE